MSEQTLKRVIQTMDGMVVVLGVLTVVLFGLWLMIDEDEE